MSDFPSFLRMNIIPLSDTPHFHYPFICWWVHGLLPPSAYLLWIMLIKHGCTNISETPCFQFFQMYTQKWSCWVTGCCCCSIAQSCPTLCDPMTAALQASLSFTISQSLLKLKSIKSLISSNHLILCHPLLLLPSIFPSIRVFSNESVLRVRWPKYRRFTIQDWFPLGLTGLLSLQSKGLSRVFSNTTVQRHEFFGVQPSLWSNSHIQTELSEKP